jgi:cytochrome P450
MPGVVARTVANLAAVLADDVLDLRDPTVVADPYPAFAVLRQQGAAVRHEGLGLWLAVRHADADAVLRERRLGRLFTARQPADVWETFNWLHADSILDCEPPKHTRLRALVAKAFARGHVERLRPRVRAIADGLLDDAVAAAGPDGVVDLVADYAEPLPVMVIAELLGVPPADQPLLRPWSQAIVKMYEYDRTPVMEEAARTAAGEFSAYVSDLARQRRGAPGEDLVSHLAAVEDGGQRLSERELVATCVLLLNAGHEASVNGFGNGMAALLRNPDQLARLVANPWGLAPTAVEEMLRYDAPLQLFERTAKEDVEVAGVGLRAGDKIAALLGSANRDPEVFVAADAMDVSRDPNPHLGFGAGIHFCLGAPLARVELQASVPLLLERFPGVTLAGAARLRPTFVLRGCETLPVALSS